MKVTTELKRVIERAFGLKADEASKVFETSCKEKIKKVKSEIESSSEFQNYKKACEELYEYLLPDITLAGDSWATQGGKPYYYSNDATHNIKHPSVNQFVYECINSYKRNHYNQDYSAEKDTLLVKLTYEKDLEKIKEILKEYNIVI